MDESGQRLMPSQYRSYFEAVIVTEKWLQWAGLWLGFFSVGVGLHDSKGLRVSYGK